MNPRVALGSVEIDLARQLAGQTLSRYQESSGHYRNTPNSHLIGRLGELACEKWMVERAPTESIFRELARENECDILFDRIRVEVKTWQDVFWGKWGRCIAVKQMHSIRKKADVVVWCSTDGILNGQARVELRGWNPISDLDSVTPVWTGPEGKQVHNYQLSESQLRSVATLLARGSQSS